MFNLELAFRKGETVKFLGTNPKRREFGYTAPQTTTIIDTLIGFHLPYLIETIDEKGTTNRHWVEQRVLERC